MTEETKEEKKETAPAKEAKVEKPEPKPTSAKATAGKEEKPTEKTKDMEVPAKFKKLVEEIEKMPVIELAELVKVLEEKFGVSAAPQMVAGPVAAGGSAEGGAEEKSSYNIELTKVGDKKIDVIKAVRDITQKGLKESKDLVDAAASAPQMIKENAKKDEAEEIKKKFEEAGATVELK